jgi:hypothetical protein
MSDNWRFTTILTFQSYLYKILINYKGEWNHNFTVRKSSRYHHNTEVITYKEKKMYLVHGSRVSYPRLSSRITLVMTSVCSGDKCLLENIMRISWGVKKDKLKEWSSTTLQRHAQPKDLPLVPTSQRSQRPPNIATLGTKPLTRGPLGDTQNSVRRIDQVKCISPLLNSNTKEGHIGLEDCWTIFNTWLPSLCLM